LFASAYHIADISHYYIPALFIWGIWIGVALDETLHGISRYRSRASRVALGAAFLAVAALLPVAQLMAHYASADKSQATAVRRRWEQILATSIPQGAIFISNDRDEMMPFWYLQYVENRRRDLVGLFPLITPEPQFDNVVRLIDAALDTGRPVLLVKPMAYLQIKYRTAPLDPPLSQILARVTGDDAQFRVSERVGGNLRVIGYDVMRSVDSLRVAVYWQVCGSLGGDYSAYMQLMDGERKIAQGNDHQMGGQFYPSSLWPVGEVLRDEQVLTLPASSPGTARLVVGMYRHPDLEPLSAPVEVGTIVLR
jgi:hypothetical protein